MVIYYQVKKVKLNRELMNLAELVRQLRAEKEWSQGQLGIKSGLGRDYISAVENDRVSFPGADKIVKLAKALDVNEDLLLEAAGFKTPPKVSDQVAQKVEELSLYLMGNQATEDEVDTLLALAEALLAKNGTRRNTGP